MRRAFEPLEKQIEKYSRFRPVPVTLQKLLYFGQNAPASKSFQFLRNELPVRLANIMQEMRLLPATLRNSRPVKSIFSLYENTFNTLLKYESVSTTDFSTLSSFCDDAYNILQRHATVIENMALGIVELRIGPHWSDTDDRHMKYFLDRFYISRMGFRMLLNQHLLIYGPTLTDNNTLIGTIDPSCSPLQVAINAYSYARNLCQKIYYCSPGCNIRVLDRSTTSDRSHSTHDLHVSVDKDGHCTQDSCYLFENQPNCADIRIEGPDIRFCYPTGHLFYVLYELLKNSMRAVIEMHLDKKDQLPRLEILICNGNEDVIIKLTDLGGGMSLDTMENIFHYNFTTAKETTTLSRMNLNAGPNFRSVNIVKSRNDEIGQMQSVDEHFSPLAGRGHGLALSRLYTRYLNGNLLLTSVQDVGTSTFIYLKRNPEKASELIPIYNRTSRNIYESGPTEQDWISTMQVNNCPHIDQTLQQMNEDDAYSSILFTTENKRNQTSKCFRTDV